MNTLPTRPLLSSDGFSTVEQAVAAVAAGKMVVVVDDEDRENEGDLIMAAEFATPEAIAFMVRWTSGVLCVGLPTERTEALNLPQMVQANDDAMGTAFTVSVDCVHETTTGISASDRAQTVRALVDAKSLASDFNRPGHIFPLRAVRGGVLRRPGHTEASVDLARMAGLQPGGVLAEIVNEDGTMARLPQLKRFAQTHGLHLITIKALQKWRRRHERLVERKSTARVPTPHGVFTAHGYVDTLTGEEHIAMVLGNLSDRPDVLVRVHSECLTGEVFRSLRCDCRPQLDLALQRISQAGTGVVVYLRGQEGRGIGLVHKLRAYALQDKGYDTVQANLQQGLEADSRDYSVGAQILQDLGVRRMRLMTNNPLKYECLSDFGLVIVERVPLITTPTTDNQRYLSDKQRILGHAMEAENTLGN